MQSLYQSHPDAYDQRDVAVVDAKANGGIMAGTARQSSRARAVGCALALIAALSVGAGGGGGIAHATSGDVIISNGTVQLGIHPEAHLNVPGGLPSSGSGTTTVGLRYVPNNAEATAPGCLCEGWGAADATSGVTGHANADDGVFNIVPVSFVTTATTAVSVVRIGSTLEVTHNYRPSTATPNLYEVTVTIKNISAAPVEPRYRRVMDWDVEPTPFQEFVTAGIGTATALLDNNNDGFATANPLGSDTSGASSVNPVVTGNFTDQGPRDHGARFDFGFPSLAAGASREFTIFYGAAGSESDANAALGAVGAEVFSFGQPNTTDGPRLGTPNTFIFAFGNVGGAPIVGGDPCATPPSGAIVGTEGENSINGTAGNDVIVGLAGNDKIYGRGGDDKIYGCDGNDEIYAGDGNDFVAAGDGQDKAVGGAGNDDLEGGAGIGDELDGQGGNDELDGGDGRGDKCTGGAGTDTTTGGCEDQYGIEQARTD